MAASKNLTARERQARARLAALTLHSRITDPAAHTAAARAAGPASLTYWERKVDPDDRLDPATRARQAEYARRAHYQRLSYLSATSRRRRSNATRT